MAAMAEPESSVKNHKEFRNNNLDCTKKIINFAKKIILYSFFHPLLAYMERKLVMI